MGQFFNSINEVRKNYSKYDDWEQTQADERAKKEYLTKNLEIPQDKVDLTTKRAQTVIRATEMMDARSEDNCQNMEQLTGILSIFPIIGIQLAQFPLTEHFIKKLADKKNKEISEIEADLNNGKINLERKWQLESIIDKKFIKKRNKTEIVVATGLAGAALLSAIGMILWGNSKQKEASRIGRYQAKQNELKDVKNFVVYTPEQIEKAQEIAKNIPDEKEHNSIMKMIVELKDVAKDKKAYKKWLKEKDPKEIEKLKTLNFTDEQLKLGEEDKELIVDTVKEINIKAEEYSENVENSFDTLQTLSWLIAAPLGFGISKLMKAFGAGNKLKAGVSFAIPIITPLIIAMQGTFEEKKASRVGRYQARKDLLKNPARLMAFSEEEMKKAENIKAPKQKQGFFEKIGDSFVFLKNYYKDKSEFNKYKKTTQKENEKLQKALKQVEITEAQAKEAKNLQKNVFRAFDEVDEMSQRYSEDVEAGTEIAKELGGTTWTIGTFAGMGLLTASIIKGKFPIVKLLNKLTNLTFEKNSTIKQAINSFHDVLMSKGKGTVKEFQEALVHRKLKDFFRKNPEIEEKYSKIGEEYLSTGINDIIMGLEKIDPKTIKNPEDLTKVFGDLIKPHFKQTWLAKWSRNMISQCTKLWIKNQASKAGTEIPKEVQELLHLNFNYKNYKTLINTGLVTGIPILGTIFAVPYAFNAWLTSIQKKAGKIGIMKAMDTIDDARVFASEENPSYQIQNSQEIPSKKDNESSNLLKKLK